MGYQSSHRGSHRGSGQRFQKSQHEKAKARAHKPRQTKGLFAEEENTVSAEMAAEKATNTLKRLGEQKFAVSPFRQYFDDWLVNIKETLSEFEAAEAIKVDEAFVKEREQTFAKVERELLEMKREEEALEPCLMELTDTNHLLVDLDADYAAKTRDTGARRNTEIQSLTQNVSNLETELNRVKALKTSFIGGLSKKAKAHKIDETTSKLTAAKAHLEKTIEAFKTEQDKMHDDYEKEKHLTMDNVQRLEKEIEKLETDKSQSARQVATEMLAKTVKALLERQPKTPALPEA